MRKVTSSKWYWWHEKDAKSRRFLRSFKKINRCWFARQAWGVGIRSIASGKKCWTKIYVWWWHGTALWMTEMWHARNLLWQDITRQKFGERKVVRKSVWHAKEFELYLHVDRILLEGFKHKSDLKRTMFLLLSRKISDDDFVHTCLTKLRSE